MPIDSCVNKGVGDFTSQAKYRKERSGRLVRSAPNVHDHDKVKIRTVKVPSHFQEGLSLPPNDGNRYYLY